MSNEKIKWYCDNCGLCCINIVVEVDGIHFGAFLLPHEIMLFPRQYVRPMYGVGQKGKTRPRPEYVYAWQNISEPCVYYDTHNRKCKIYDIRPTACKQFPISLTRKGILLHRECPQVKALISENVTITEGQVSGLESEIQAMHFMELYYYSVYVINADAYDLEHTWFYDFRNEKWVKTTKERLVRILKETGRLGGDKVNDGI